MEFVATTGSPGRRVGFRQIPPIGAELRQPDGNGLSAGMLVRNVLLDRDEMDRDRKGEQPQTFGKADLGRRELVTMERRGRRDEQVGVGEHSSRLMGPSLGPKACGQVPSLSSASVETEYLHPLD